MDGGAGSSEKFRDADLYAVWSFATAVSGGVRNLFEPTAASGVTKVAAASAGCATGKRFA